MVEVTGGEPLLQRAAQPLISRLLDRGLTVLVETSGGVRITGLDPRAVAIVDVKCPESGMADRNVAGIECQLRPRDELKLVVASRSDYEWAKGWLFKRQTVLGVERIVHLSPAFGAVEPRDLAAWILEDHLPVRLGLQLHKLIWNPTARGV